MKTTHTPWDEDYSQAWRDGFYAAQANEEPREDRPAWKHMLVVFAVGVLVNFVVYGGLYLLLSPQS